MGVANGNMEQRKTLLQPNILTLRGNYSIFRSIKPRNAQQNIYICPKNYFTFS